MRRNWYVREVDMESVSHILSSDSITNETKLGHRLDDSC